MSDSELFGPLHHILRPHCHQDRDAENNCGKGSDVSFAFCRDADETSAQAEQKEQRDRIDRQSKQIEQYACDFCSDRSDEILNGFIASVFQHGKIRLIVRQYGQNKQEKENQNQHISEFEFSLFLYHFSGHAKTSRIR